MPSPAPSPVPTPRTDGHAAHRPDVTVVVVAWASAAFLGACLDSVAAQTGVDGRVRTVVVDNASRDGTAALLAGRDDVSVMRTPVNLGFAGGVALALGQVATPYAVLLNDDAELAPDALAHLLAAVEGPGASRVGAVTARVLLAGRFSPVAATSPTRDDDVVTADGQLVRADPMGDVTLVNSTGNVVRVDGFGGDRDWLAVDDGQRASGPVFGVSGAAALLRMSAVREVGGVDARLFMYYEDTDLSWRLRLGGWEVVYEAGAVVHHRHATSSGEGSTSFRFHDDRNRLLVLTKNASPGLLLRTVPRYPVTALAVARRAASPRAALAVRARVLGSYARLLPHVLRERRAAGRLAAASGTSRRAVERLLAPVPERPTGAYRRPGAG